MKKKHNIHDSGYKKLFSNHEMIKQLLTSFVDEEWIKCIEYDTLERIDKSFISDEFAQRESDLIYKARLSGNDLYIFILLEFQSTVDRFMSLRMLRYIIELYEYLIKNYRMKKLPAVFPLMLYNGEKKWTAPLELNKLIDDSIPSKYIPGFRYYGIFENQFSRDFLLKLENAVAALFLTENCDGSELKNEIDIIVRLLKNEKPAEFSLFINWFRYMFHERTELVDEICGISEVKTMLRTSIKKYGEQLAKDNMLKGMRKGIHKKAVETARKLLDENMSVEKIAEITGLSADEVMKFKK